MKWFKKMTASEYASSSASVVSPSVVLAGSDVKFGGNLAMTDDTNFEFMKLLRDTGVISADKTSITLEEASQITSFPSALMNATGTLTATSIRELMFFTGFSTWPATFRGLGTTEDALNREMIPFTTTDIASSALQSRLSVRKIFIPDRTIYGDGVKILRDRVIRQNYYLRYLYLPSTLTTVQANNFNRLGWRGSNSGIASSAFVGDDPCVLAVVCMAKVPPSVVSTDNNFFVHGSFNLTGILDLKIYVPDESVSAYRTATWWTNYAQYILPLSKCTVSFYDSFDWYYLSRHARDTGDRTITYTLTHLTVEQGPSSIAAGASETIVISPETGHILPLAVRVINATLDSYDRTTGTIVVSNPTGDVEIVADAICTDYHILWPAAITDYSGNYYCIAVFSGTQSNTRACAVLSREGLSNPCTWG